MAYYGYDYGYPGYYGSYSHVRPYSPYSPYSPYGGYDPYDPYYSGGYYRRPWDRRGGWRREPRCRWECY